MSTESGTAQTPGARLRRRRRALQLTLSDVAARAEVTEGHLSSIERGRSNASVSTLQRICSVLRLNVGDLFAQAASPTQPVLRFQDAKGVAFGEGASKIKLTPAHFDHLELLLGHFEPSGSTGVEPYTHGDSEEVLLVIAGDVEVTIDGETHALTAFDSVHYRSSRPHRVAESTGTAEARVLWAMSPPTY
ncbi:helix-turn-helix domain-containing protein [Streptomyces smyrnaeus]|uniref:helix-turn-helix domain-containing protein n=1 Tax=Streptomyces TaxID=1883 RepID=UPI000C19DFBF|nr:MULTISPECIES: XRE family transcriptional regulator [unclassified Streptomyces]MBQ0866917.1 helix-turn-helix transcriptional regulator [Streptomyces sp. RK75]MBQ1124905.1 helix-turn-helix transcriptional regulator [Streptomyces sp. B15]MBQ1160838.1 helix-turn-helix transcriptional regulator [Streptomyces sp. A73]